MVQLGENADARILLRFGTNFTTEQGTGTVTVYLSTSDPFTASPGTGNPYLTLFHKLDDHFNVVLAGASYNDQFFSRKNIYGGPAPSLGVAYRW